MNPGNSGFTGIRNDTYVDKSGMISRIVVSLKGTEPQKEESYGRTAA
ncbi:MAG: hypothetical protein HFI98_09390 [Lachnospiraceae bacterium]|nr:hypothetical protein [Lachnospiraceae bacterium]